MHFSNCCSVSRLHLWELNGLTKTLKKIRIPLTKNNQHYNSFLSQIYMLGSSEIKLFVVIAYIKTVYLPSIKIYHLFYPFPKWQILDSSNLKKFEDNKFGFDENGREFSDRVENTLRAISSFPAVFSKDLYCIHVKTRACLGKGYKKKMKTWH